MTDREKALEAALRDIARQRKTDEMPREDRRNGDFEGACDTMIDVARAALAMPATVDRASWEAGRDAAAAECERLRESYRRSLSLYPEDDPQHRLVKYSGATAAVCAENIRNLTPPEDAP
jgi:hypothetical protein